MNIVQINITNRLGSTGKIVDVLNKEIKKSGNSGYVVAAFSDDFTVKDAFFTKKSFNAVERRKDILVSRLSGKTGYRYKKKTEKIVKWIEDKNPDLIHLHNIHGDWINLECLFEYIKNKKIPIVWTLHDCWAFTGRCSYFENISCEKWKTGCYDCKNKNVYPITYFRDKSKKMWEDKQKWFKNIGDMVIVTPSKWLSEYVKESLLKEYPITVIHNGIDTDVYQPELDATAIFNNLQDKKIILGVANAWSQRKGLNDFIELDKVIDHTKYQIVLVGLNAMQLKSLPDSIIGIERTSCEEELVQIYSRADVFLNLTYQDNYPTTNLEAISCGTPVITYRTGGSPESVEETGIVLEKGNINSVLSAIEELCNNAPSAESLHEYAQQKFDKMIAYKKYIQMYEALVNRKDECN